MPDDCQWTPHTPTAHAVFAAGFCYDPAQDIIYSRMNALQRRMGYTYGYDVSSAALAMIIDCEDFYFTWGGLKWLIELWKGQYGLETGAEIGVYYRDAGTAPSLDRGPWYQCSRDPMMQWVKPSFKLRTKGGLLMERGPKCHWWLTGFKWGVFTQHTSDLTMDVSIEFLPPAPLQGQPGATMHALFMKAVEERGYTATLTGTTVQFQFKYPRAHQPGSRRLLETPMQAFNAELVAKYLALKKQMGLRTNDPNGFTEEKAAAAARPLLAKPAVRKVIGAIENLGRMVPHPHVVHANAGLHDPLAVFSAFHSGVWRGTPHA